MSYEQIRVNEKLGYPTCDQEGCESPVHMTFVWTRPRQYCLIHGNAALQVAQGMGFPTPQDTAQRFDLYEFEKWRSKMEDDLWWKILDAIVDSLMEAQDDEG